jgi:hypothetical protein
MNSKIVALSMMVLVVSAASAVAVFQLLNQGAVSSQASEEMLQIEF